MKPWNGPSLRARLTWRMVLMQALVLMAFSSVVAIPIVKLVSEDQGLDAGVIENIADSVQRSADGGLQLVLDDDILEEAAEYPNLWFYATDIDGNSVQFGEMPERASNLLDDLPRVNSANFVDIGPAEAAAAIVRRHDSAAGQLWIITGGGPEVRLKIIFTVFREPIFLGLLTMLTLVSFLVIPVIVRQQLRGVAHVAAEADRIDVDQRGIRLSSAHVPEELHSLVGAVNSALQRLDDGMERRQRFLADAAHELRTPIAILQTRIELLPEGEERSRLMLDVARLANLANQLLDLQRLDSDVTVFQPVNLVDLAAEVTADMAPLAIAAGDDISFDAEADSVTVAGDRASLSRAIVNLIQNAIIHGGRKTAIRVAVGRDGSLRVADTGPGIAATYREAIFEPFNRIVPLEQGAGLGLNLVRDIVVRHNGQITVGDAPGGGALFEIFLPLATAQAS
ncbi:MAG: HAMP domain-containing histidine kinase [Alphaproteobacteria bacterium]|nr:HAMP domain-containing histidine kinase [Alphaproteobacteria bacterium]MBU1560355.1 HAMP domain-containing histidine kinase [Alphaproteobacteria bacterium]MBU2303680.1 HAMP domain-containing histidine kinase [Alphaproteobacteria bacterium]MBU2366279.1 HAMP domain-containing histidine kinase [Alphaproteobacteria bacterium]